MLHYYPQHVSSTNMPIFRRKNCIIAASGIVTLCKRLYNTPVVYTSALRNSLACFGASCVPSSWSPLSI